MTDNTHKRAIIISAVKAESQMKKYWHPGDFVVACDAGYLNADRLGLVPDLIIGDFDSAPHPTKYGGKTIVLPHIKDDTDTFYAARWLTEHGYNEIIMLGALGGARLEHSVANISTALFLAQNGVEVCVADTHSELRILTPGKQMMLTGQGWKYLSLFPLEGRLTGVTLRGVFYPLEAATMDVNSSLGVSNEFTEDVATLYCLSGYGLVILSKSDE